MTDPRKIETEEQPRGAASGSAPLSLDAFSTTDWLLLTGVALTWGSSFVWIELALESFEPALIALIRVVFGALTLSLFRKARAKIKRRDLKSIVLLGILWMAAPFLLFPIAQQWIDSSLAGMINGGVPIFAGAMAAILMRRWPPMRTILGILIGFGGVIAVSWPAVQDSRATALGAGLVLLATIFYGIAINIAVPLQQRYGSLPVLLRAQLVAFLVTLGPGAYAAQHSAFSWTSLGAMIPLGCLGTGMAFVWMSTLAGRVGAARASVTIYFIPVIAIVLGAVFQDEEIAGVSLFGTVLVLAGAFLASRTQAGGARRSAVQTEAEVISERAR